MSRSAVTSNPASSRTSFSVFDAMDWSTSHQPPGRAQVPVVFVNEKNSAVCKHSRPRVDLRRLVACLIAEQVMDLFGWKTGSRGEHFGGDLPQLRVTLPVILVLPILQPGLRDIVRVGKGGDERLHNAEGQHND